MSANDRLGTFTLTSEKPNLEFQASLARAPIVVDGYGGWQKIARRKRKSLTEWIGRNPLSIKIEFVLDNFSEGAGFDVEAACRDLERMAGVDKDDPEPPLLRLWSDPAPLMPHGQHRAAHNRFFIEEGPAWDADKTVYNIEGNRLRAAGSLTVTQHVRDELVTVTPTVTRRRQAAAKKSPSMTAATSRYVVRRGDTLAIIAARKTGAASNWKKIATANGIRDPKAIKVGQVLRIP